MTLAVVNNNIINAVSTTIKYFMMPLNCTCILLGDNRIQNVHLGRYIVGYMVGSFVLRRRVRGAVKRNFRPYNRWYTSPNEHFEYGYPHSNALFNIYSSRAQHFAPNWSFVSNVKQLRQPITSNVTYDIGAATVYRRVYWRKFLTLSNQTSRYIRKCIRIHTDSSTHFVTDSWFQSLSKQLQLWCHENGFVRNCDDLLGMYNYYIDGHLLFISVLMSGQIRGRG